MMTGTFSEEIEVKATADEAWKVYGNIKVGDITFEKLPDILQNTEILEGVGMVIKFTFVPVRPGLTYQIEKFTVVDDEKRLKIVDVTEGGHIALGFTKFRVLLQVLEKDENTCITKATVEYEIRADASDNVCFVSAKPFVAMLNAVADILTPRRPEYIMNK